MMIISTRKLALTLALGGVLLAGAANATTYTDNFTGKSATLQWTHLNDACLTAGDGTGSIPACSSITWMNGQKYTIPGSDTTPGQGALLLTPPKNDQTGAILSGFPPFPLSQGIAITFTTYTYGGDSGGTAKNGADGIVFFLTDGTQAAPTQAGGEGGSMGYGCSNDNGVYDGVAYGYLGLGIDEFGNFLNSGDNGTNPQLSPTGVNGGIYNTNDPGNTANYGITPPPNGTNSYYNSNGGTIYPGKGPQYQPQRIGLRGAGNTNWAWLQSQNPSYYSGSSNQGQVQAACSTGTYYALVNGQNVQTAIPYNYNAIPGGYAILPDGTTKTASGTTIPAEPIANEAAQALNPATGKPAPWPITYRLTISSGGLLNFAYSYNNGNFTPVLTNFDITKANGPLPASLRFGFSAGTGGSNNVHEITCFKASPLQANSSAGSNTITGKVTGNSQFFLASYSSDNWWGSLVADPLLISTDGTLSVGTNANWDAKCTLTGGPCDSMGVDASGTPTTNVTGQTPAQRDMLTSTATGAGNGVALPVTGNSAAAAYSALSAAEQAALNVPTSNALDTTPGQTRLGWLLGVRSNEQLASGCTSPPGASPSCDMRARTYVLGDIINSSPTFVGAPAAGIEPDAFVDQFNGGSASAQPENATGAQKFSAFVAAQANRLNVVYVGSNDGFVHGFEAGYNGNGAPGAAGNDGQEVFAYMPYDVLMNKAANLANPLYSHDYLVDATPVAGDVFYANAWHTWLVGGVGSTGQEIYALDITNPGTATSPAMTASNVIGDWDNTTLTHLGDTVGTPIIARMHNGDWAFIFGSGLVNPSASGTTPPTEGVYVGLIDPATGKVTFQFLDTGVAPTGVTACPAPPVTPPPATPPPPVACPGGIAYVSQVDLDGDHIADYLYAGDTQGRVWRFDVTSTSQSNWSGVGTNKPFLLFQATNASGSPQPITTSIVPLAVQTGLVTRDMLYFGTGQQMQATGSSSALYTTGQQTFYGIWDWNLGAWNKKSSVQYAALKSGSVTPSNLLVQTVQPPPTGTPPSPTLRYLSNTAVVCWQGDTATCSAGRANNQYGWMFNLPDTGPTTGSLVGQQEQIIYNPTFIDGAIVVNTAIPPEISAALCNPGLQSGFTMAFDPATGGGFAQGFFPDAGGGFSGGAATVGGTQVSGVGTPTEVQYGGNSYLVTQTISGGAKLFRINPPYNNNPARVSWREIVNQ